MPAKRGKGRARKENDDETPEQRHRAMTWARRLKKRHTTLLVVHLE